MAKIVRKTPIVVIESYDDLLNFKDDSEFDFVVPKLVLWVCKSYVGKLMLKCLGSCSSCILSAKAYRDLRENEIKSVKLISQKDKSYGL